MYASGWRALSCTTKQVDRSRTVQGNGNSSCSVERIGALQFRFKFNFYRPIFLNGPGCGDATGKGMFQPSVGLIPALRGANLALERRLIISPSARTLLPHLTPEA